MILKQGIKFFKYLQTSSENQVYECLSSSPECDSSLELRHVDGNHANHKRKSDSSAIESNVEFKYHQPTFTRSTSLPYCGSETESELYAPYSFYTGDEVNIFIEIELINVVKNLTLCLLQPNFQ